MESFFGETVGTNTIHGTVYHDWWGDGGYSGDWGLMGVVVELYEDVNGNGLPDDGLPPYRRTATDWWGDFSFTQIPDGDVVVVEIDPAGSTSTNDVQGHPTDNIVALTLAGFQTWTGVLFLDTWVAEKKLQGSVRIDTDGSGTFSQEDAPHEDLWIGLYVDLDADGKLDPEDVLVDSTTTGDDGKYTFWYVTSGHYIVSKATLAGITGIWDEDGGSVNGLDAIAVQMTGQPSNGHNFLNATDSISGKVRHDLDGDGDFSDQDDGLLGVQVHLYEDTNGNQQFDPGTDLKLVETTTRRAGNFSFLGVADGSYLVVEIDPAGASSTNDTGGVAMQATGTDSWIHVQVEGGESSNDAEFLDTNVPAATIRGKVLNDLDGDGDLDDADDVLSGVEVRLYTDPNGDGDPEDGMNLNVDPTNLKGNYSFRNVVPGDYVLVEEDPDDATSTNDADDDALGGGGTDNRIAVTLVGDATITKRNFLDTGAQVSSIKGIVLNDDDATNDNVVGVEDQRIGGVKIEIFKDLDGNRLKDVGEHPVGTVLSATDGTFVVPNLVEGTYLLRETDPAGAISEFDTDGAPDDNVIGLYLQDVDSTGHVFLDDGIATHAISGRVTNGEDPISGVAITLTNETGGSLDMIQTAPDGSFTFPNLPDGSYTLTEANPAGATGGSDADGGDPDVTEIILAGSDSSGNDFIDLGISLSAISGAVFDETNWNSIIDEDDAPIAGAFISLFQDTNANGWADPGEPLLARTHTGWDGSYRFSGLMDGDYVVTSINVGGFSVTDADGSFNGIDAIAVTLAGGTDSPHNDFLDEGITLRHIRGSVTDGSNPIQGVVLVLTNADGDFIEATATNSDGEYIFPNLPNGDYLVHEIDPAGTTGGSDFDGPSNGDNTIAVTIFFMNISGRNFTDVIEAQHFHSISGRVLDDTDTDGNTDSTERPVDGLELALYRDADENGDADGNEIVSQTCTDPDGRFVFSQIADGNYLVKALPMPGSVSQATGTSSGDPAVLAVSVAGQDSDDNTLTAAIDPAGYFFDSLTGEILTGGHIDVIPSGFGVPTIIQSGINGQYSFVVDSAGTYTMVITPPEGYFVDPARPVAASSYDPTGMPDPDVIGSIEDPANPGYLVDSSAGTNPYYLVFDLEPGDPLVLSNNIPLRTQATRSFPQFLADLNVPGGSDSQPVPDQAGIGGNPDRDVQSNLLEYALTEDPNTGASPNHGGFRVDLVDQTAGRIDASFTRHVGTLDLIYTIQTKDQLIGTWSDFVTIPAGQDAPEPFIVTPNGDGTESVVYPDLPNAAGSGLTSDLGFVRLRVSLDADQNGAADTLADGTPALDHTASFGWQCSGFNTAQIASFSHPFSNAPVFSGTIDYVQGAAVNVASSSNNFDLSGIITGGGACYLQVTSGPLEGQRFDIASAAVIALTLFDDPDIFADSVGVTSLNTSSGLPTNADLAGESFVVIPHLTVDQLFDKNAAFAGQASGIPSRAAKLFFYNNRSDNPGLESLILVDLGAEQRWIRSNDLAQLTDRGAMPIDRCAGTYVYPGLGPVTDQFAIGMVADHAVAASFSSGYNLAGSPFPLDQTPTGVDGRAMTVANGFAGGINPNQASELLFWTGDFAVDQGATYVQGYDSYMQLDGAGMRRWIDVSDQQLNDLGLSLLMESHRAVTIKVPSGTRIEAHTYPVPAQP